MEILKAKANRRQCKEGKIRIFQFQCNERRNKININLKWFEFHLKFLYFIIKFQWFMGLFRVEWEECPIEFYIIHNFSLILNLIKFLFFFPLIVPPNIDDSLSSSDVIVREGSNVTLKCRAQGSPQPTIKWKRDDNSKININKSLSGNY
jgi:hypothetical protein